ncbi:NAD(P)H-dependent flavin oxidoreductase [Pleomorphomonas oryzae]|uniref:NAD(P)H-dependent flavin oxidoreductase n=1 Tax=Pleomorphomonas oryzae TaxID=261934 RepID=UPI00040C2E20|nr:nitronate monooxygenase [Pleomorphomonas oryzae]
MNSTARAEAFCRRFGLTLPILLAPMAGASAPTLSAAVGRAGGMGALGALLMQPQEIRDWVRDVRAESPGIFQLNLWIPDPAPKRDAEREGKVRAFLSAWGPEVPTSAGDAVPPDFSAQCEALLEARPTAISSVMGLFPPDYVKRVKAAGIAWFAVVSTVDEAKQAEAAGADVIIAQGMEAGGHRAAFHAETAERDLVGLFSLIPAVVDAVKVPVVATGGIADGRGVAAALTLGASAVQIGTAFLRCPEAKIHPAWADAIGRTLPEQTQLSRVFSGRAGRSVATAYVRAATGGNAPQPAPYPVQRGLTAPMRGEAGRQNDIERMQAWAGQSAALSTTAPAGEVTRRIWTEARGLLGT